jgi:ribonuclease BN (tRNA processing enzyme)
VRLQFLGTKGYVEATSDSHRGHSAFTLEAGGFRLLCDFGENQKGRLGQIRPDAILVSHAHPDHAWGLAEGTDVPVHASEVTHELLAGFALSRRVVLPREEEISAVGPFRVTAFPVIHSLRCPGLAARIETPEGTLVYSGDIVSFATSSAAGRALEAADVYVGDGSTLTGSLVRRHASGVLMGHTTMRAQLGWLAKAGITRAIFSHFGDEAIAMGDAKLSACLEDLTRAKAPGCEVRVATDGAEFRFSFAVPSPEPGPILGPGPRRRERKKGKSKPGSVPG